MRPVNSTHESLITAKRQIPISRVTIFDTCKTVPSEGFNVAFYTLPDTDDTTLSTLLNDTSPVWYENTDVTEIFGGSDIVEFQPAMAFDWGIGGVPPALGQSQLYGIKWTGYFFARYSGAYTFYIDACSFGRLRIKFNGSYLTFYDADDVATDKWNTDRTNTEELDAQTASLTAGQWYAIQIEFAVGRNEEAYTEPTYLCIKYKEPTGATTAYGLWGDTGGDIVSDYAADADKKILSPGVVNTTNSFLTGTEITDIVESLSGDHAADENAQYEFSVGMSVSTWLTQAVGIGAGYLTVQSTDGFPKSGKLMLGSTSTLISYTGKTTTRFTGVSGVLTTYDINDRVTMPNGQYAFNPQTKDFGVIKPYRLVKIEFGHRDPDTDMDYYSPVIWGHVYPNPKISRRDNKDIATFYVQDFGNMLNTVLVQNFPDYASYSGAGYYNKLTSGQPDGFNRPVTYDRWICEDAVRDIYIKAGIDPVLLYQRKHLQVTGTCATDYGGYLIEAPFNLANQANYGNSTTTSEDEEDAYLWFFGYGTKLQEVMATFASTFGRLVGFTADGFARFQTVDLPFDYIDCKDAECTEYGTWTAVNAFDAYRGHYKYSTNADDYLSFAATGSEFALVVGRHSTFGTIRIEVDGNPVTAIKVGGEILTNDDAPGEYDLDYADCADTDPWLYYDGADSTGNNPSLIQICTKYDYGAHTITVMVMNTDPGKPYIDSLLCYDNTIEYSVRDIDTDIILAGDGLDATFDTENMRNDIAVVGVTQGLFQDSEGKTVNPNNPTYLHIFSRSVDVYSMYDTSKSNYIGRRMLFEIYNASINTQEIADYISIENLIKYRSPVFYPDCTIPGDYRLEYGDCITLHDLKTKTTTDTDSLWIERLTHTFTRDAGGQFKLITAIQTTPRKPVKSFERRPALDIDTDWNGEPLANIVLKSQGKRISGNDISVASAYVYEIADDPGWATNMWAGYLISVFGTITVGSDTFPVLVDEIESNTSNTLTVRGLTLTNFDFGEDLTWGISFDPFDTYSKGAALEIGYDQLVTGKVKVMIKDNEGRVVATVNESTRNEIVEWGSGKKQYWSGVFQKYTEGDETNYFINNEEFIPNVGALKRPLVVAFEVTDIDTNKIYSITSKVKDQQYAGIIKKATSNVFTEMSNSDVAAIFPYIINCPPILYLDDENGAPILNSGRITACNISILGLLLTIDNTSGGILLVGKIISIPLGISNDDKKGNHYWTINSVTINPTNLVLNCTINAFTTPYITTDFIDRHYIIFDSEMFSNFQSSDNSFRGLKLHVKQADIYIDDPCEYKTSGDELLVNADFSIWYNGAEYAFSENDPIDFAAFSKWEYDHKTSSGYSSYRLVYWDANNPLKLYWTQLDRWASGDSERENMMKQLSRIMNPRMGIFPIYMGPAFTLAWSYNRIVNQINFPTCSIPDAGIYYSIDRFDYSVYGTHDDNKNLLHEWDSAGGDNWSTATGYPKVADLQAIYYAPEADGNAFRDIPNDTDLATEYMGRIFVFTTDFRDRAGRYPCNLSRLSTQEKLPHKYLNYSADSPVGIELESIKTDALPVVWHPLTYSSAHYYTIYSNLLNSWNLWGIGNFNIKVFKD